MLMISPHPDQRGAFRLESELWLAHPRPDVFSFFADAYNLERITPPWLSFSVITPQPILMQSGTRIDYHLRVHGLSLRWRSEITEWTPEERFVDRQLRGPYRLWLHLHTFEEQDGGTLVKDQVDYAVPGGWLMHKLFVRRDIESIFSYRRDVLPAILAEAVRTASEPTG